MVSCEGREARVKVGKAGVKGVERNKFTTRSCEFAKTRRALAFCMSQSPLGNMVATWLGAG